MHDPAIGKRREREPLDVFNLIRFTPDVWKTLLQGFLLSALLELFVVLSPFYMQRTVDEAIAKGDNDLLLGLAAAFALLYVFNAGATAFRSFVFQYLGNTLSFAMEARLFHHLIRLPLSYFQKRAVGDLLQRFHALEPVKNLIVGGAASPRCWTAHFPSSPPSSCSPTTSGSPPSSSASSPSTPPYASPPAASPAASLRTPSWPRPRNKPASSKRCAPSRLSKPAAARPSAKAPGRTSMRTSIALADREPYLLSQSNHEYQIQGHIELRNLRFRYAPRERDVLKDLTLEITPGECIVIFGASGGGKSTLLKLLTGLDEPTEGEVLFDGLPLSAIGLNVLRPQLGIVMQEDRLLAGSIAENIALFDDRIDMDRVRKAARDCLVHDEIMRFPMQYNSLVGDMGSALSSGKKQRVLLARALYRNPRVLVMDEGTAHLDPERESTIRALLRALPITRVIVAHSPAMAAIADRVFLVEGGRLLPAPGPENETEISASAPMRHDGAKELDRPSW